MRIAIVAPGGVGGNFGGLLAKSGEDVMALARGAHLAAIKAGGLRGPMRHLNPRTFVSLDTCPGYARKLHIARD
jgi:ketopantoate reductase